MPRGKKAAPKKFGKKQMYIRSYYLTEDQHEWLKRMTEGTPLSSSDVLRAIIDKMRESGQFEQIKTEFRQKRLAEQLKELVKESSLTDVQDVLKRMPV